MTCPLSADDQTATSRLTVERRSCSGPGWEEAGLSAAPRHAGFDHLAACDASAGWVVRRCGPIELRYRPYSHAANEIDALEARFVGGLSTVRRVLGLGDARLPEMIICIVDLPAEVDAREGASEARRRGDPPLALSVVHTPEAPCTVPEIDLMRLLIPHLFGPASPRARFWDEGIIGYVAGQYRSLSLRC